MHPTFLICTVKERWYREFFEEIQDKVQEEARGGARILDSGKTQRGERWYLCLLVTNKAFEYALLASLTKDEDVQEVVQLPLSRLSSHLFPLFLQERREQQQP